MNHSPDTAEAVRAAARRLAGAAETARPCAPVRDLIGADDITAAYAVQHQLTIDRQAAGATVTGRKIGLTSPSVQKQLGVDRPDFGVLFDEMECVDGVVPTGRLIAPKVEAEIAFVLGDDLADGELTLHQVRSAVEYAVAALEIVDSRILNWDITFGDTVADNASSAKYVLGRDRRTLAEVEPKDVTMTLAVGDEVVSQGAGVECLGDPLVALQWLARTAAALGDPLLAGQVILSGALGPMVAVPPGGSVTARSSGFDEVTAVFEEVS
ncbi:2-keto-4-pentenoate hydratase [Flexivirga meconopsidis]|uniref:2-keto-4-pentenoate hydratase n=1 Tax=Flexivirga meconopsidis TaxID=2977121 RepID=UPI00223EA460|nr:fumarylacetoacetate hydrolase family protein [Flexivirga meconopsidis]